MELDEARTTLGLTASAGWEEIRAAYRRLIVDAHPDRVGATGTDRTIRLNTAFRVLSLARRQGELVPAAPPATTPPAPPPRPSGGPADVRLLDADTLVFDTLPDETFRRLVEAGYDLGHVAYIDRSAALLEVIVQLVDGTTASLLLSLQWRAHNATCEVFATMEALERAEQLDVSGVLGQLAALVPVARS